VDNQTKIEIAYLAAQHAAIREAGLEAPSLLPRKERLKRLKTYSQIMDNYMKGDLAS
jgi:hypothetical protein